MMTQEERRLRRKLSSLRISHSHIHNAMGVDGQGTPARRQKLKQVKEAAARLYKRHHNKGRAHSSLGYPRPAKFAAKRRHSQEKVGGSCRRSESVPTGGHRRVHLVSSERATQQAELYTSEWRQDGVWTQL